MQELQLLGMNLRKTWRLRWLADGMPGKKNFISPSLNINAKGSIWVVQKQWVDKRHSQKWPVKTLWKHEGRILPPHSHITHRDTFLAGSNTLEWWYLHLRHAAQGLALNSYLRFPHPPPSSNLTSLSHGVTTLYWAPFSWASSSSAPSTTPWSIITGTWGHHRTVKIIEASNLIFNSLLWLLECWPHSKCQIKIFGWINEWILTDS